MERFLEIENGFITNKPVGIPDAEWRGWIYYIFARKVALRKDGSVSRARRYLHVITGRTRAEASRNLRRLVARKSPCPVRVVVTDGTMQGRVAPARRARLG